MSLATQANSGTGTSTSAAVTLPAWTVGPSDFIFVFVAEVGNFAITAPTGYTTLLAKAGSSPYSAVFYKQAVSGDSAATVTATLATATSWAVQARVISNATLDANSTIKVNTASTSIAFSAVAPTVAHDLAVAFVATLPASGVTDAITAPSGSGIIKTTASSKATSINVDTASWDALTSTTGSQTPTSATHTASTASNAVYITLTPRSRATVSFKTISEYGVTESTDNSAILLPNGWKGDGTIPAVIWLHGAQTFGTTINSILTDGSVEMPFLSKLACHFPVYMSDFGGPSTSGISPEVTAIETGRTHIISTYGVKSGAVMLFGGSGGHLMAVQYANAHKTNVAGIGMIIPVCSMSDVYYRVWPNLLSVTDADMLPGNDWEADGACTLANTPAITIDGHPTSTMTATAVGAMYPTLATEVPVTAGTTYLFSAKIIAATVSASCGIDIDWYSGITYLSSSSASFTDNASTPTTMSLTATAPVGATLAKLYIYPVTASSIGEQHSFTEVLFGNAASTYGPQVDAAWGPYDSGLTGSPPTASLIENMATGLSGVPWKAWYGMGDQLVNPVTVQTFASNIGGTAEVTSTIYDHSDAEITAAPIDEIIKFCYSCLGTWQA